MHIGVTAIVILNYNNLRDTINCVRSVEACNSARIKYIVVDNGSKPEVVEALDAEFSSMFSGRYLRADEGSFCGGVLPYLTLLVSHVNDGYAKGNNKGFVLLGGDEEVTHVMVLNSDILFVEDMIPKLIDACSTLPNAAIVSPALYKNNLEDYDYNCARNEYRIWDIIGTYMLWNYNLFGFQDRVNKRRFVLIENPSLADEKYVEIDLPQGSCMLFERTLLDRILLFDPNTFLYYEELIIGKQIKKIGLKNYLLPKLKCVHLGATTTSQSVSSFVLKEDLKSAVYYMNNYENLTAFQRFSFGIAVRFYRIKIFLLRMIKNK